VPGSHWMVVSSGENFERSLGHGLTLLGLRGRHRKKAERMLPGDRILFFVAGRDCFAATATVASAFFEEHTNIWVSGESRPDDFPWRVRLRPDIILDPQDCIDAHQIAPRLLYLKRWPPEQWPLAFQGQVHLLSAQDFRLIEVEMERLVRGRQARRRGMQRNGAAGERMIPGQGRERQEL
jgi:hypothetical protein